MGKKHILIVEDDEVLTKLYGQVLAMQLPQYPFTTVTNGVEALDVLCKTQCDLVITDLNMPLLDGDELYRQALEMSSKESREMPAFIFCSALRRALDSVRETCTGTRDHFILKPFKWQQVCDIIIAELERDLPCASC